MPAIDLSILNQRQTPAFYADTLANRPAAGFVGRIFVSTNTFAFFRDNGIGWDLIGGPGTGTVTGTGANGQVTFWNGASTITGTNDLFWDNVNGHFGIGTNTPGTALDVHHDQSTVAILNQTVATNDTRLAFQNSGSAKWRVGNFYSAGSNDYKVNDATLNINRFTIKSTSGQTFIGDEVTSTGLLVVNSNSSDAHIVALGATAPSIRVRNAGVGASLQFGLGLSTAVNNFIQGSTGGEFCIFNDSLTAQPILFGIKDTGLGNTQEAARISPARNFLVGTTTDAGYKLDINGTGIFRNSVKMGTASQVSTATTATGADIIVGTGADSSPAFQVWDDNSLTIPRFNVTRIGNVGIGTNLPNAYTNYTTLTINGANGGELDFESNNVLIASMYSSSAQFVIETAISSPLILKTNLIELQEYLAAKTYLSAQQQTRAKSYKLMEQQQ